MANKAYTNRLKSTSTTDDSNGYDILGHLRDAGTFVATEQMPTRASAASVNPLDDELKRQRLLTGTPEAKLERARAMGGFKLEQDAAKIEAERARQDAADAQGGGQPQGMPNLGGGFGLSGLNPTPAFLQGDSAPAIGAMSSGKTPRFEVIPKDVKERQWNPNTGRYDAPQVDYGVGVNPQFKAQQKAEAEKKKEVDSINSGMSDNQLFYRQYGRSLKELRNFDQNVDKPGAEGFVARAGAQVGNAFGSFPETAAFEAELEPRANLTARTIEGGRITDQDRQVYARAMVSALRQPSAQSVRMASNELLKLQAKGGDISQVMAELEGSDVDVLRAIVQEVRSQTPEQLLNDGGELSGMSDEQLRVELARLTNGR